MQVDPGIVNILQNNQRFLLMTHANPDGDAMGSSLALFHVLRKFDKQVQVVVPDKIPAFLEFLPGVEQVWVYDQTPEKIAAYLEQPTVLVCLDLNNRDRLGALGRFLREADPWLYIMIDHHPHPEIFGQLMYHNDTIGSTAELVYELIVQMHWKKKIDRAIAECLYTGVMTDTGSFRFANVTTNTHLMIAELLKQGIRHETIHQRVHDQNSLNKMRLWGYATYQKLTLIQQYNLAFIGLSQRELTQFNAQQGYLEGLCNHLLTLKEAKVALVFSQKEDFVKVSFRSEARFAVNEMAQRFFQGGGHFNAAGGRFDGTLEEALVYFQQTVLPYYALNLSIL